MITSLEKLRGFVEGFALRFVQDLHQIFFFIWDQESLKIRSFLLKIWDGFGLITTVCYCSGHRVTRDSWLRLANL